MIKYIDDMLRQGYTLDRIKSQLADHGYPASLIEETFIDNPSIIKKRKESDRLNHGEKIFILCFGTAMLLFILWAGLMTSASVFVVFTSFLPVMLTIVITYIMFEDSKKRFRYIVWFIPFIANMLYFYLAKSGSVPPLVNTDAGNIVVLNIIISAIFLFLISIVPSMKKIEIRTPAGKKEYYKPVTEEGSEEGLKGYIASINKNSTALNLVIGRVYTVKHGAVKGMRDLIKIKSGKITEKSVNAKKTVHKTYNQLRNLLRAESDVFANDYKKLKMLTRDPNGGSRIIDVLVVNAPEPVQTYFQSAVDSCHKAIEEIKMAEHKKRHH